MKPPRSCRAVGEAAPYPSSAGRDRRLRRGRAEAAEPACQTCVAHRCRRRSGRHRPPRRICGSRHRQPTSEPAQRPSHHQRQRHHGQRRPGQGQTGAALLTDATMLSPDQAKVIDRDRTWKVTSTEQNPSEDAPAAACFSGEPPVGQLAPQQKILRVLDGGGKKAPPRCTRRRRTARWMMPPRRT